MSATAREREDFLVRMSREGVPLDVARKLLRYGATLQRLAELDCSSEWADRDRVPCPASKTDDAKDCLCDFDRSLADGSEHGTVKRIDVQGQRTERRCVALLVPYRLKAMFGGDPRGCVLTVVRADVEREDFDSGRERGLAVPA